MIKLDELVKLAGVSTATASLALNNKPGVKAATKKRVLALATEYNYQRLRKPKKRKYDRITRLVFCIDDIGLKKKYLDYPIIKDLFTDLSELFDKKNIKLIHSVIEGNNIVDKLSEFERHLHTDSILVMATGLDTSEIIAINKSFKKVIFVDNMKHKINANFISINNYIGGYIAGKHLTEMNHRNIGYIRGNRQIQNFNERFEGFTASLKEANTTLNQNYILQADNMEITKQIINFSAVNIKEIPTAFFCENDYIAASAIEYFENNGLNVPSDISIIGFDGLSDKLLLDHNITSVLYDTKEIAKACYQATISDSYIFQTMVNPKLTIHDTVRRR